MNRWLKKYKEEGPGDFYKTRYGEITQRYSIAIKRSFLGDLAICVPLEISVLIAKIKRENNVELYTSE